jgi:hypothetical protein
MKLMLGKTFGSPLQEDQALMEGTRHLSQLRRCFDKSLEIDQRRREVFCEIVRADREVYTDREIEIFNEGTKMFSHFEGQGAKSIAMIPPTTKAKEAYVASDRRAWGWSSTMVRASAVDILAWTWDLKARATQREDDIQKEYVTTPNDHNYLVYIKKRSTKVVADRDFLSRATWRATGSGGFEYVSSPEESEKRQHQEGVVRAAYPSAMRIVKLAENETRLEYVIHPDSGGSIPGWLMSFFFAADLAYVTEIQEYFQRLRRLSEYDEKDGAAVGDTFMIKTKKERQRKRGTSKYQSRVASVVKSHVALKEFSALHFWFPSLVAGMLSRKLSDMTFISTKLENLSNREAMQIGRSFSVPLRARKSAQAGCDVWINEYPALVFLAKSERFFVAFAQTVGQRKIETAPWGLFWKVGVGAVLSVLDVATDVYAIANFTLRRKEGYARAVIAGVSVSIAIQLLIVYGNGKKRGMKHVMKEAMIVLSGVKPAVDAFRVIGGAAAHEDDTFDPMYELILAKVVEM